MIFRTQAHLTQEQCRWHFDKLTHKAKEVYNKCFSAKNQEHIPLHLQQSLQQRQVKQQTLIFKNAKNGLNLGWQNSCFVTNAMRCVLFGNSYTSEPEVKPWVSMGLLGVLPTFSATTGAVLGISVGAILGFSDCKEVRFLDKEVVVVKQINRAALWGATLFSLPGFAVYYALLLVFEIGSLGFALTGAYLGLAVGLGSGLLASTYQCLAWGFGHQPIETQMAATVLAEHAIPNSGLDTENPSATSNKTLRGCLQEILKNPQIQLADKTRQKLSEFEQGLKRSLPIAKCFDALKESISFFPEIASFIRERRPCSRQKIDQLFQKYSSLIQENLQRLNVGESLFVPTGIDKKKEEIAGARTALSEIFQYTFVVIVNLFKNNNLESLSIFGKSLTIFGSLYALVIQLQKYYALYSTHHVLLSFKRTEDDSFILQVYNTKGTGSNYHPEIIDSDPHKAKFESSLRFILPKEKIMQTNNQQTSWLQSLLEVSVYNEDVDQAERFYAILFQLDLQKKTYDDEAYLSHLNSMTRSNVCGWKEYIVALRETMDDTKEFKKIMLLIRLSNLRHYLCTLQSKETVDTDSCMVLDAAYSNFCRAMLKLIQKEHLSADEGLTILYQVEPVEQYLKKLARKIPTYRAAFFEIAQSSRVFLQKSSPVKAICPQETALDGALLHLEAPAKWIPSENGANFSDHLSNILKECKALRSRGDLLQVLYTYEAVKGLPPLDFSNRDNVWGRLRDKVAVMRILSDILDETIAAGVGLRLKDVAFHATVSRLELALYRLAYDLLMPYLSVDGEAKYADGELYPFDLAARVKDKSHCTSFFQHRMVFESGLISKWAGAIPSSNLYAIFYKIDRVFFSCHVLPVVWPEDKDVKSYLHDWSYVKYDKGEYETLLNLANELIPGEKIQLNSLCPLPESTQPLPTEDKRRRKKLSRELKRQANVLVNKLMTLYCALGRESDSEHLPPAAIAFSLMRGCARLYDVSLYERFSKPLEKINVLPQIPQISCVAKLHKANWMDVDVDVDVVHVDFFSETKILAPVRSPTTIDFLVQIIVQIMGGRPVPYDSWPWRRRAQEQKEDAVDENLSDLLHLNYNFSMLRGCYYGDDKIYDVGENDLFLKLIKENKKMLKHERVFFMNMVFGQSAAIKPWLALQYYDKNIEALNNPLHQSVLAAAFWGIFKAMKAQGSDGSSFHQNYLLQSLVHHPESRQQLKDFLEKSWQRSSRNHRHLKALLCIGQLIGNLHFFASSLPKEKADVIPLLPLRQYIKTLLNHQHIEPEYYSALSTLFLSTSIPGEFLEEEDTIAMALAFAYYDSM